MRKALSALAFALAVGSAALASAASIDLTGAAGAEVAATGTLEDADVGTITFAAYPGDSTITYSSSGLGIDCQAEGLYCIGDNPLQIDMQEMMSITFEDDVFVSSIDVSNLFVEYQKWVLAYVPETGGVESDLGYVFFTAMDAVGGNLTVDLNVVTSELRLYSGFGLTNDYSLAGLTVSASPAAQIGPGATRPMPEPNAATLFFLGSVLISMAVRRV